MKVASWGLVLGALLFSGGLARAEGIRFDAGYGHETGIWGAPRYLYATAAISIIPLAGLEVSSGLRLGFAGTLPSPSIAGYLRTLLFVRRGFYRPAIGLELEATSATDAEPGPNNPTSSMLRYYVADNQKNWLRIATVAIPLRYRVARLTLSALELRIATPLSGEVGERGYVSVGFFTLGYER